MATNGESPRAARSGCSARSNRLLKPMLSYIGAFIQAQSEGLWCVWCEDASRSDRLILVLPPRGLSALQLDGLSSQDHIDERADVAATAAPTAAIRRQVGPPPPPLPSRRLLCRDAEAKPDGWIPLVVAENKLGNSLVLEKLEAVRGFPPAVMNYSGCVPHGVLNKSSALAAARALL